MPGGFKEHVYVFFCNALYIHSNGAFQNGAKPLGPEPFGSERLDMSSSTCLQAELLEAEGQHGNDYYNLRLANPDYPDHSCAFIRA